MTITKSAWTAVAAVLATLAVVLVAVFVPTNSAGAADYTEWTNDGPVVTTHKNVAPGTDTDTVRWLPVGEPTKHVTVEAVPARYTAWSDWVVVNANATAEEAAAIPAPTETEEWYAEGNEDGTEPTTVTTYQHYSWTGGRRLVTNPPTEVPPSANWQPNTTKEPHKSATWVNDSLHYMPRSKGFAAWFYLDTIVTEVPGKDETYTITKRTRTLIPAVEEVSHLDYKWQKQVRTVVTDNPTAPVETPTVPTETPTVPVETPEPPVENEQPETPTPNEPENETPVSTPQPPKDVQVVECVNGVWVTTVNGEVISKSGSCDESSVTVTTPVEAVEEGL